MRQVSSGAIPVSRDRHNEHHRVIVNIFSGFRSRPSDSPISIWNDARSLRMALNSAVVEAVARIANGQRLPAAPD
jgi:hypothetical protein